MKQLISFISFKYLIQIIEFLDHMRLLSTFSSDGNIDMVKFMLSMPGIHDTKTADGSTALSMAIARGDTTMAETLLGFYSQQKITFSNNPKW